MPCTACMAVALPRYSPLPTISIVVAVGVLTSTGLFTVDPNGPPGTSPRGALLTRPGMTPGDLPGLPGHIPAPGLETLLTGWVVGGAPLSPAARVQAGLSRICHQMYWQVQPTTVPKVEQGGGGPPSKVSHDNAGGLLPAHAWQMDHEGGTARHTKLAFVVRYNKQRHGLVPIRPHVILCNGITLKPSMYTMLIGSDESDA